MEAMSHAPRFYTMGARHPLFDLKLDGKTFYCATDGCGVETIDFITRKRRRSKKEDVASMARVSDYLSALSFYWPIVSAQDHPKTAPLHEIDAAFNNTVKHVQSETIMGEWTAQYAIEMADVVAGSEQARRERPPLSLLVCSIAPWLKTGMGWNQHYSLLRQVFRLDLCRWLTQVQLLQRPSQAHW
jgi:trimethylamine:corrinoid methyltransferase-like protein